MSDGIIQTRSGIAFSLIEPSPDMVSLDDIAWSLSNICRYNGHCSRFYSVAEHSYVGALHMAGAFGRLTQQAFLLHDAAEAYIGDVCRPLKRLLGDEIAAIEHRIVETVYARFGLSAVPSGHIRVVDDQMLAYEVRHLVPAPLVGEWPDMSQTPEIGVNLGDEPERAHQRFLGAAALLGVA